MGFENRRAQIINRIANHVLARGLAASQLRPLAKAAATSDRMLLYYFADKAEIIAAALDTISARLLLLLGAHAAEKPLPLAALTERLTAVLLDDEIWPYMRLWLEIASLSARGDAFYRGVGEKLGRGFLAWGASQLECDSAEKRETEAAKLLVTIEGMVLLKSLGLDDAIEQASRGN